MLGLRRIKSTLFGMLFVMTDGSGKPPQSAFRNLTILFLIDLGQLLRVMMMPNYGWNEDTYNTAKYIDIVYVASKILGLIMPRYVFFAGAFLLVGVAVGDAIYCVRLFKGGEVQKIGPVKVLRVLVMVVVTTLFSSVIKWLLIPIECLASGERSFSSYIHNNDAKCTPFSIPEIAVSVPTMAMAVVYICFAMTASFFSLGTNPLRCAPQASYTGRVEAMFLMSKIFATILPYVARYITSVAISIICLLNICGVFYSHLSIMPFHSHATNALRGGIYGAVTWLGFSSVIVSIVKEIETVPADIKQTMQWMLLGGVPVAFPIGVWIVNIQRSRILKAIDRLRGDWEHHQETLSVQRSQTPSMDGFGIGSPSHRTGKSSAAAAPILRGEARERTNYEIFFDPSWERKRAFTSGTHAHTIARVLLYERREDDLPFLAHVINRGLEEHPDSDVLQIFRVSLLRFVFCNAQEASLEEKKLRNSNQKLALDHEYVLYAVERKATQDQAAQSMGKGNFNAINLMEFDSGMQAARTAHLMCILEMRKFWSSVYKSRKSKDIQLLGRDAVNRLREFNKYLNQARNEYQALLEKYPQSVQLLQAYASFLDVVVNDSREAEEKRKQAVAIEGNTEADISEGKNAELEAAERQSAATSDQESSRCQSRRYFNTWSDNIFGFEHTALKKLDSRVKILLVLLLVVYGIGFTVLQYWLFKSMAMKDVHLIDRTGLLRAWSITNTFLIRSQMLAGWKNDTKTVQSIAGTIETLADKFKNQHWSNYEIIRSDNVYKYYTDPGIVAAVPVGSDFVPKTYTFWEFGNDWTRRMDRASVTSAEELADPNYKLDEISESKQNVAFMMENAFRVVIPAFEDIVRLYEAEMQKLSGLTEHVVACITSANLALIVITSALVIRGAKTTLSKLDHMNLACNSAIQLPYVTTKKIFHYYRDAENEMRAFDDEEAQKKLLEDSEGAELHLKNTGQDSESQEGGDDTSYLDQEPFSGRPDADLADALPNGEGVKAPTQEPQQERWQEDHSSVLPCSALTEENIHQFTGPYPGTPTKENYGPGPRKMIRKMDSQASEHSMMSIQEDIQGWIQSGFRPLSRPPSGNQDSEAAQPQTNDLDHTETVDADTGEKLKSHDLDDPPSASIPSAAIEDMQPTQQSDVILVVNAPEEAAAQLEDRASDNVKLPKVVRRLLPSDGGDTDASKLYPEAVDETPPTVEIDDQAQTHGLLPRPCSRSSQDSILRHPCNSFKKKGPETDYHISFGKTLQRAMSFSKISSGDGNSDEKEQKFVADTVETLPINQVPDDLASVIEKELLRHQPFQLRISVYVLCFALVTAVSLLNWVYPTREMQHLVTLAPTINQAGRRRFLTRSCIHLSRELVLDDGFSRMRKVELASALNHYLSELRIANDAVRLGGALNIELGADYHNPEHNEVMYGKGCPWREDPTDCSTPERPRAAEEGLHHLALSFFDAVQSVLLRHGPPPDQYTEDFLQNPRLLEDPGEFDEVTLTTEKLALLTSDPDMPFILSSFKGDLFSGFHHVVLIFDEEMKHIVHHAMHDNQTIFIFNVCVLVLCFYVFLFRQAVAHAREENLKARSFVSMMPSHCLSQPEAHTIAKIFGGDHAVSAVSY